ncbi:hypothetical protein [Carboxylicivirga sp. M1479]|uniref:hypothetical protein n=1 Tax=Carboxylicivirga sp. M1479 TaxID=2594476 RepID=UPI00117883C6|nr:hypothetical protein [Carboxylicivirga sp. M1479]TRX64259.1 hypothetical protein FNN09_18030 [Carboxylicivirga sp. M1479]
MKKFSVLLIAFSLFQSAFVLNAQDEVKTDGSNVEENKPFKDKLFAGGSLGLSFGDYTNVTVSPVIGVRFNPKVYAGLGLEYQYTKDKRYTPSYTYNQYGGRIFTQYNIVPNLFAHAEVAGYSMERYVLSEKERDFVPFVYIGGGYRQMLSKRSFVTMQVLFDVLQHQHSPYNSWEPIFSVGFGVGI